MTTPSESTGEVVIVGGVGEKGVVFSVLLVSKISDYTEYNLDLGLL